MQDRRDGRFYCNRPREVIVEMTNRVFRSKESLDAYMEACIFIKAQVQGSALPIADVLFGMRAAVFDGYLVRDQELDIEVLEMLQGQG